MVSRASLESLPRDLLVILLEESQVAIPSSNMIYYTKEFLVPSNFPSDSPSHHSNPLQPRYTKKTIAFCPICEHVVLKEIPICIRKCYYCSVDHCVFQMLKGHIQKKFVEEDDSHWYHVDCAKKLGYQRCSHSFITENCDNVSRKKCSCGKDICEHCFCMSN